MARKKTTKTDESSKPTTVAMADPATPIKEGETESEMPVKTTNPDEKKEAEVIEKAKKESKELEAPTVDGGFSQPEDIEVKPSEAPIPEASDDNPAVKVAGYSVQQGNFHERVLWRDSFPTSWSVFKTPHEDIWSAKCTMSIGDFKTPLEFELAVAALADKLIDKYDGVRRSVPKEFEPTDQNGKITVPKAGGFDINDFRDMIDPVQLRAISDTRRGMFIRGRGPMYEDAFYVGAPWEVKLIEHASALWKADMKKIRDVHDAFKTVLDTNEYSVGPLPNKFLSIPDTYVINWENARYDILQSMLDQNRILHQPYVELSATEIMKLLEVVATSEALKTSELRKTLRINNNIQTGLTDITNVISKDKAFGMLHMIVMSTLFRKYFAMDYEVTLTAFSFVTLIECVLIMLLVPEYCLTKTARTRIRNYVLEHLLCNLKSAFTNTKSRVLRYVRPTLHEFDTIDFLDRNKTLLPPAYAAFFLSWGNGGDSIPYTFSSIPKQYSDGTVSELSTVDVVGRSYGFMPWGGRLVRDWTYLSSQQSNFEAFINILSSDDFLTGNIYRSDDAIRRLFTFFSQRRESISQLMYYSNEVMKRMAVSPLCMPQERDESIESGMFTKPIEGGMITSLLTILIPESFHARPPTLDLITAGRGVSLGMKRFIESYYLHTDIMPKRSYFKSEIIEAAFTHMPESPIKRALSSVILGAPEKHHFIFPPRSMIEGVPSRYYSMKTVARDIVKQNPYDFGYTNYFYYTPRPRKQYGVVPSRPELYEYYIIDPDPEDVMFTYTFSHLLDDLTTHNYSRRTDDAYHSGKYIKFDFPVKISMMEAPPNDGRELPPFNYLMQSRDRITDKLTADMITVFYQWKQQYINARLNSEADSRPPLYQVPNGTYKFNCFNEFMTYPRRQLTFRSGVEDVSINDFITMVRRSDI
jgi:hypothetical protein